MAGRKSLKEEIRIIERLSVLSEPTFKYIQEMYDTGGKADKKWAVEQMIKLYAKCIPTEIVGDPDNPIVFMPSDLITKNGINQNTIPSDSKIGSAGLPQISSSELRPEVGKDNPGSVGNDSQSSVKEQPAGSVPGPDVPASEGHSVGSPAESVNPSPVEGERKPTGTSA